MGCSKIQDITPNDPTSLQGRIVQYLKDHPLIWDKNKFGQNLELYEVFEAKGKIMKAQVRNAKQFYLDKIERELDSQIAFSDPILNVKDKIKKKIKQLHSKQEGVFDEYALNPEKVNIWSLSDDDLVDLYIKFVGYIGYENVDGKAIIDSKGEIHRGEAIPEPIDEITGDYMGIQEYQAEAILTYRDNDNILNIWFRGGGKTWKSSWIVEFTQKYKCEKFLYFSLTDVAYIVANWVYVWAQNQEAIVQDSVVKEKKKLTGRKDSYQKFTLINGARLEIHGIRTASTLGYHGWVIIFDDIIDISHKRLTHLQDTLQTRWNSQYSKIRRKKFIMDNTRKFEGDFFDFIITQFETKAEAFKQRKGYIPKKYTLCIDLKTPYTDLQYMGDIAGYRKFIDDMNADRIRYNINKIIAPWYEADDFEIMKLEDWESFYAEMLGNPKSLEGGMVKPSDIVYVQRPHFAEGVQMGGCGIDCASTEDENNDYTAVESCLMSAILNKEKKQVEKRFTFWKSDVSRMLARNHVVENINDPFDWIDDKGRRIKRGIFETTQLHVEEHKHYYPNIPYIVAWERNNAGIALMEQALRDYRNKEEVEIRKGEWVILDFPKYFVEDPNQAVKWKRKGKSNVRLGITHIKEKQTRIYSELKYSIETGESRFTFNMEDSLGMAQLLAYPRGKHDDSPDARGMIKDELKRRWKTVKTRKAYREPREEKLQQERLSKEWVKMKEPWTAQQNTLKHRHNKNRKLRI